MNYRNLIIVALLSSAGATAASTVTYGDSLIDRPVDDGAAGSIFVQPQPLFPGTLDSWGFYDNDVPAGKNVTPLILERTGAGTFAIRGIGTTRTSTAAGAQNFSFGLVSGSNSTGANFYMGWKDGGNGSDNAGSIDFEDATLRNVQWLGAGHTNFLVGDTKVVNFSLDRTYSLSFDLTVTGSAVGDAPHQRATSDTAVGSIFALNDALPIGQTMSHWNLFDLGDAGQNVTPLLLENVAGSYFVRGIGTTRASNGAGGQVFDFGLVSGTDVVGANFVMGFKDGSNGTDNDGVIDFDNNGADNVVWFGAVTGFSNGQNLGGGALNLGRSYSIQGLFVPEPSTAALGLLALTGLLRRRR
jgi:hypothetical protein